MENMLKKEERERRNGNKDGRNKGKREERGVGCLKNLCGYQGNGENYIFLVGVLFSN